MTRFVQNKVIGTPQDIGRLADLLSKCPEVTRYDAGEHKEAWALTHSFADIEGSMLVFLGEYLPKLTRGDLAPGEVYETLLDIGEEFRHILYHIIEQQKFYRYLLPEGTDSAKPPTNP
jgi:hypothetical protein